MNKPNVDMLPDEHLRTALRHAPDADSAAPADVSAQIRAAAWRAVAGKNTRRATSLQRAVVWFDKPSRLGASGAFATLVLAGVVGLIWQQEQPGPARPPAALIEAAPQLESAPVAQAPSPTTPLPAVVTPSSPVVEAERPAAKAERPAARARVVARPVLPAPPPQASAGADKVSQTADTDNPAADAVRQSAATARSTPEPAPVAAAGALVTPNLPSAAPAANAAPTPSAATASKRDAQAAFSQRAPLARERNSALAAPAWPQALFTSGTGMAWRQAHGGASELPADVLKVLAGLPEAAWQATGRDARGADAEAWLLQRNGMLVAQLWLGADSVRICEVLPLAEQRCAQASVKGLR